jgi:hypothetical protein
MKSIADKLAARLASLAPFGRRAGDPLSNVKAAARWIENLPVGDAFKCQQAILGELVRFNEISSGCSKDRLAILMLLDEKSRDLQDTLVRQYLRNPRMSRAAESQLWHAVYGLYWEVARGYHTCVARLTREQGKTPHDGAGPLITLRAILAFGQLMKWRAIRYLPAGEKFWQRLHKLYLVAENEGFLRTAQRAYAGDATASTCEAAYLRILMLDLANSGTLYPRQLDQVASWLGSWDGMLQLHKELDVDAHNFVIDLSSDHGPRRIRKPDADTNMRFWTTARLLQELHDIRAGLHDGSDAAEPGLTEHARGTENVELLDHLVHQWSSLGAREQRRAPRTAIKRLVDVTHGLNAIVKHMIDAVEPVSASPYGTGLSYDEVNDLEVYGFVTERTRERVSQIHAPASLNPPDVERWVMQDESEHGYGTIVETRDRDWLRVGVLIAVKSPNDTAWRIGIVRRMSRVNDDTSSVGIETLAATPTLVTLHDAAAAVYTVNGMDNTGASTPLPALWLSGEGHADSVVIDPVHFLPDRIFEADGVPGQRLVALGNPIEHSEGWIRVSVKPVSS